MRSFIYILFSATILFASCSKDNSTGATADSASVGKGGSLARFTIANDRLYVVDDLKLYTYSLENPNAPRLTGSVILGEDIETIYSYKDKLFIGSQNAMYIYSIATPDQPFKLGQASHVRACDPVVATDTVAYVTVRNGNACGGGDNALYVYNVTNVLKPKQVNMVSMASPWGLGLAGDYLFICNGSSGMSIYDVSEPYNPNFLKSLKDATYFDVIVYDNMLICMVEGGTLLYELKNNGQIIKLGMINS
jgi:hypothetical protein